MGMAALNMKEYVLMFIITNKTFLICIILAALMGCKQSGKYILQLDKNERPITGCIFVSDNNIGSLWMSMKCQASVISNIKICTQKRALMEYEQKDKCSEFYDAFKAKNGTYTLKSDVYEN